MTASGRPRGQLDRSLEALTIGVQQGVERRRRVLEEGATAEHDQQVQVAFSGSAGTRWGYTDKEVDFEYPFLYAPTQREVPFEHPHFSHSFEVHTVSTMLIHMGAQVIGWRHSDENWIVASRVRLYATAPHAIEEPVPFRATAHLTFQGYSTYREGDELQ